MSEVEIHCFIATNIAHFYENRDNLLQQSVYELDHLLPNNVVAEEERIRKDFDIKFPSATSLQRGNHLLRVMAISNYPVERFHELHQEKLLKKCDEVEVLESKYEELKKVFLKA